MKFLEKISSSVKPYWAGITGYISRKLNYVPEEPYVLDKKTKVIVEIIIYSMVFLFLLDDYMIRRIEVYATLVIAAAALLIQLNLYKEKRIGDQEKRTKDQKKIMKLREEEIVEKCSLITENILKYAKRDTNGDIRIISTLDYGEDIKTVSGINYAIEWKFKYTYKIDSFRFGFAIRRVCEDGVSHLDKNFQSIEYNVEDGNYSVSVFHYKSPNVPVKEGSEIDMELTDFSDEDWKSLIRLMFHITNDDWWKRS